MTNPMPPSLESILSEFDGIYPALTYEGVKSFIEKTYKAGQAEMLKACGGCKECYGKGYATTKVQGQRRGYKWDLNPIRPCSCDRGKQIEALLSNKEIKG